MKRLGLPVLVLVLALVLFAVWKVTRTSPAETASPEAASSSPADARAPEETSLSVLDRSESTEDQAEREGVAANEASASKLENWDVARSRWVEGVVRIPAGCTEDEGLEVFATSEPADANRIADLARSEKPPAGLLSRRPVEKDGSFRVPFPPDTTVGHVSVLGRYLLLPDSVTIDWKGAPASGSARVDLAPVCGAWITGTATLPAESPVSLGDLDGLKITLRTSMESFRGSVSALLQVRRETKLRQGTFEFRGIPAEVVASLEMEPERLAASATKIDKLAAGRENPVQVALLRGGTVRGIVRDTERNPLGQASVVAARPGQWFGFDNREVRETKSAADGSFELPAVTPGRVVLTADVDGYLESERKSIDLADGGLQSEVDLEVSRGESISGRVTWPDGKPAAEIDVKVAFDMSQMAGMGAFNALRGRDGEKKTDAQGAFTVTGLGKGPFTVDARAEPPEGAEGAEGQETEVAPEDLPLLAPEAATGDATPKPEKRKPKRSSWWSAHLDGVAPGTKGLELVLKKPEGVAGRVQDETGAPVTKFRIEAAREGKGLMGNIGQEPRRESFEDAEGRFVFAGLTEGAWKLYAIAEGFGLPEPVIFDIPRASDAPELAITIEHAASVSGVVKGPRGELVAGAEVKVDSGGPAWQAMLQGGPKAPTAKSGSDGTFLLEGLHAGNLAIVADSENHAKSLPVEVELKVGELLEGAVIVLREGGSLTGEVFGEGGKPASGLFVQATQMKDFENSMTFTDRDGKFRIEHLLPGSWQVVAMPSRGEGEEKTPEASDASDSTDEAMAMFSKMKMAVVTIVEAEETHVVLGAPPKDPVEVHGTVTHAGEPLAGAMVVFMGEGKESLKGMKSSKVQKDGAYSVKLDAPGHYSVSVQRIIGGMGEQSTVEFSEEIPKGEKHRLDFVMPTARISGRVRGPDGAPAAGARISLHPETAVEVGTMWGGQFHEGTADAEGNFDVKMLRPGTYSLGAGGQTMGGMFSGDAPFGREIKSGLKLSEGEWMRDVEFRLKKPGTVEVTVVDAGGSPVGEASVFVREAEGRLVDGFSMVSTTADGKASYSGLGPGTYTVSARKDLLASIDSARVKVEEAGAAAVQVALQPGTMLIVTCVGEESKPVRASVSVQNEEGREVGGMISLAEVMKLFGEGGLSTTEHKVGPLPQGKYKVKATGPDGKVEKKEVSLTGQAERKLTIRFD